MITIIKKPTVYRIECPKCGSLLQFDKSDIKDYSENYQPSYSYINCPTGCEKIILPNNLDTITVNE